MLGDFEKQSLPKVGKEFVNVRCSYFRIIMAVVFITGLSAVIGLIVDTLTESLYKGSIAFLATILGCILIVIGYYALRYCEHVRNPHISMGAHFLLTPFRILEELISSLCFRM